MAVPSSGALSLGQIRQELQTGNYNAGPYTANATALDVAENGGYVAINTCSPSYPDGGNPAAMSEWYGYDQDAVCLNSYYAMNTGPATEQNMLYNLNKPYSAVSGTRPDPTSNMAVSFWMKIKDDSQTQGYLYGLFSSTDSLYVGWSTSEDPNNPGVYLNFLFFFYQSSVGSVGSQINISDDNNAGISGVAPNAKWGPFNAGNVDTTGYVLITMSIAYNEWGSPTYLTWYWNEEKMFCDWTSSGSYDISYTYGDSIVQPNWASAEMYVGGSVPSELSAGCQLDGFAIFLDSSIDAGQQFTLLNGGAVAALSAYAAITSNYLFYNFENASPNLGFEDSSYGFNLDEYNSPIRVDEPAQ